MASDPRDEQVSADLGLLKGFRYLVRNGYRDFLDASRIGRKLRDGTISLEQFRQAINDRFPPSAESKPSP
jgi:hypothetical protein